LKFHSKRQSNHNFFRVFLAGDVSLQEAILDPIETSLLLIQLRDQAGAMWNRWNPPPDRGEPLAPKFIVRSFVTREPPGERRGMGVDIAKSFQKPRIMSPSSSPRPPMGVAQNRSSTAIEKGEQSWESQGGGKENRREDVKSGRPTFQCEPPPIQDSVNRGFENSEETGSSPGNGSTLSGRPSELGSLS
jgi:hypothetical protein